MKSSLHFFLFLLLVVPLSVCAHGAGAFYETTDGEYIIDVGFTSPAPAAGESVIFDFQLRGKDTQLVSGSDAEFSNVWVRVESEKGTMLLATGVYNMEFGGPRMSYVFPKEGTYTVFVRYEHEGNTLASASFPMTVVPSSSSNAVPSTSIVGAVLFFLLGVFSFYLYQKHLAVFFRKKILG